MNENDMIASVKKFETKANEIIKEIMVKKAKSFSNYLESHKIFRDEFSPFELLFNAAKVIEMFTVEDKYPDFNKDLAELEKTVVPLLYKHMEKLDEKGYGSSDYKYRSFATMLISLGVKLFTLEEYQNEVILKLIDNDNISLEDLYVMFSASLWNISEKTFDALNKHCGGNFEKQFDNFLDKNDFVEKDKKEISKDDKLEIFKSIELGIYKVPYIYNLLDTGIITAIEIMQNVSGESYTDLMEKLTEYNKSQLK